MGSIPLPALQVKTPEQPNMLEVMRGMQQLQAGRQEQQARQIQIQNAQQQQKDQATYQQALASTNGDAQAALKLISGKVLPQSYNAFLKADTDARKELSEKDAKDFDLLQKKHGALADIYQQALNLPNDKYAQAWPQIAARAKEIEPKLQLDPAQPIPKQQLSQLGIGLSVTDNYIKSEAEKRAAAKAEAELPGIKADSKIKEQEAALTPEERAGLKSTEQKEMADFIAHPPKGYRGTPTDFLKWKATLAPVAQINVANAAGGGMTDAATDQAAERYHMTGQLPPGNRGVSGLAQNRKIMNRAAELYPGSMTADSAEYKANAESLKGLQKNLDAVSAFENTAIKNIDLLLEQGKKVIDSGSPWINKPLRTLSQSGMGSADLAAFNAARQVAINEIAKVTSSPGLTGQLSDSARHEVEAFIPSNATLEQTMRVAQVLKQDMANRHQSYQEQIDSIKKRMPGKKTEEGGKKADPLGIL